MPTNYTLPGRKDGADGLLELANRLGPASAFILIRTCRTAQGDGADPGGDTLRILARRIFRAETRRCGDPEAGRRATAARLGYTSTDRQGFYRRILAREPAGKGDPELLRMARDHGDAAVFDLIRLARTSNKGAEHDPGRHVLTELAQRMVRAEMDNAGVDELTARQNVADRLGYTAKRDGNSRSNFTKIYQGGRAPELRPRSDQRAMGNR